MFLLEVTWSFVSLKPGIKTTAQGESISDLCCKHQYTVRVIFKYFLFIKKKTPSFVGGTQFQCQCILSLFANLYFNFRMI